MCDRLLVMQAGRAVESLTRAQLRAREPTEDYTRQLLIASEGFRPSTANDPSP